ncbi:MAG: hypothetical protein AAGD23_00640 [Pseudomonadota bacterium]
MPREPKATELNEADLDQVAGGLSHDPVFEEVRAGQVSDDNKVSRLEGQFSSRNKKGDKSKRLFEEYGPVK